MALSFEQGAIFAVLIALLGMLAWGRFRYDVVAMGALLISVVLGLVPAGEAFSGFGHPATITVALVLILSKAMFDSGALDPITRLIQPMSKTVTGHIGALSSIGALLSAFMNNVGALGLLLPVGLATATKRKRAASMLLMPLAAGCILGGLLTLIGTPPNVIVATYRADAMGDSFGMFDYTPVGAAVMIAGIAFVVLVGWRLVPKREAGESDGERTMFDLDSYLAEVRVPKDSDTVGAKVSEIAELGSDINFEVVGLYRRRRRINTNRQDPKIKSSDILLIEGNPEAIERFTEKTGTKLAHDKSLAGELLKSGSATLAEVVVQPGSEAEGRRVGHLRLPSRHGLALIGLSRQGEPIQGRLANLILRAGDVLLVQGEPEDVSAAVARLNFLPLAERSPRMGLRAGHLWVIGAFAAAILAASFELMPITIAFGLAVLALVISGWLPLRSLYRSVDWPVIVLLGALIPVGQALETTGGTAVIVDGIRWATAGTSPVVALTLILVVTMTVSDLLNNAATAVVMAPVSVELAESLSVNPDAFLMAVAVGASCAFLTPIGHQNNALVMGPGGYRFGDYWRMGLPLEVVIVVVAVPMILLVWPL